MWLKELKIALIQKDTDSLKKLFEDIPHLSDPKEIEEALYLTKAATELVESLKLDTKNSMKKIRQTIDYLNSATANTTAKFDITS